MLQGSRLSWIKRSSNRIPRHYWLIGMFLLLIAFSNANAALTDTFDVNTTCSQTGCRDTDLSLKLLRLMFGGVSNTLDGATFTTTANPLIAEIFRIFNYGILTLAGLLITYTVVLSTINLAQDGSQALTGKVSPFVLLRIVAGCTLLVPSFSGYSGIQVIIMSVVVQGIAFANSAWSQAVALVDTGAVSSGVTIANQTDVPKLILSLLDHNYKTGDNYTITSNSSFKISDHCKEDTKVKASDLYSMALCTIILQYSDKAGSNISGITLNYNYGYNVQTTTDGPCNSNLGSGAAELCFGKTVPGSTSYDAGDGNLCGTITFADSVEARAAEPAVSTAFAAARSDWNRRFVTVRSETDADGFVSYFSEESGIVSTFEDCDNITGSSSNSTSDLEVEVKKLGSRCQIANSLHNIAKAYGYSLAGNYASELFSASAAASGTNNNLADVAGMQKGGWATAGQYYSELNEGSSADAEEVTISSNVDTVLKHVGSVKSKVNDNTAYCGLNVAMFNMEGTTPDGNQFWDYVGYPDDGKTDNSSDPKAFAAFISALYDYKLAEDEQNSRSSSAASSFDQSGFEDNSLTSSNSSMDAAACSAAKILVKASTGFRDDMPAYLYSSNVLQPWNILEAFGADIGGSSSSNTYGSTAGGAERDPTIATDHAMHNMMLTLFMGVEALTGMKVFNVDNFSKKAYKEYAAKVSFWSPTCEQIITNCSDQVGGTQSDFSTRGFLHQMGRFGCLRGIGFDGKITNVEKIGLYGMVFLDQFNSAERPNPLRSLANTGLTMMRGAVLYYIITMEQVFETLVNLTLINVSITTVIKLAIAFLNAYSAGAYEALFVGLAALIDSLSQMMLQLDKYALELFLPLGSAVAAIFFTQGVMLGVYLPFLAFFLYVFGVIGWLISVTEAMVAAPLMALGLTHPEGHDLLGQAEQGLMLLLGVFLRPIGMIIGLFLSISLSMVAVNLVNYGFMFVIFDYFSNIAGIDAGAVGSGVTAKVTMISTLGLFMVYSYLSYSILEMSFSLIYQIPDRITKWIGGQDAQSDAGQMAKSIGGQTKQMADQGASAAGSAVKAPQTGQGGASGVSVGGAAKEDDKKDDSDSGTGSNTGGGSGSVGNS